MQRLFDQCGRPEVGNIFCECALLWPATRRSLLQLLGQLGHGGMAQTVALHPIGDIP
jgi:hypothetical protein